MRLDVDLQQFLRFKLRVSVEQNKVSEETSAQPAVVFAVKSAAQDVFLNGSAGLTTAEYDIEVYGTDPDAVDRVTDAARTALNGFRGQMGMTFLLCGFARDQDGDYVPKAQLATDAGLHLNTFVWKAMF